MGCWSVAITLAPDLERALCNPEICVANILTKQVHVITFKHWAQVIQLCWFLLYMPIFQPIKKANSFCSANFIKIKIQFSKNIFVIILNFYLEFWLYLKQLGYNFSLIFSLSNYICLNLISKHFDLKFCAETRQTLLHSITFFLY